jgi:lipopolysaccharide export system permease protein
MHFRMETTRVLLAEFMIRYIFSPLNLYFCRQLSFWFFTSLGLILAVVNLFEFIELLRRSMGKVDVGAGLILEMVFLKTPHHLQTLLPFILFFAAVIALWRLNGTQEILACRIMGTSLWQFVFGLFLVPLVLGAIYLVILNPLSSAMTARLYQLEESVFKNTMGRLSILENGLWFRESFQGKTTIFHSQEYDMNSNTFTNVSLYLFEDGVRYAGRVDANKGTLVDNKWVFDNADYWDEKNHHTKHVNFSLDTTLTLKKVRDGYVEPNLVSFWRMPQYIQRLKDNGLSTVRFRLYWHGQIAKIGLMISMILLATTFSIHHTRYNNVSRLVLLGLLSGFLIHFSSDIVYALGMAQKIPIFLAAWLPALVTAMVSISILLHLEDGR